MCARSEAFHYFTTHGLALIVSVTRLEYDGFVDHNGECYYRLDDDDNGHVHFVPVNWRKYTNRCGKPHRRAATSPPALLCRCRYLSWRSHSHATLPTTRIWLQTASTDSTTAVKQRRTST